MTTYLTAAPKANYAAAERDDLLDMENTMQFASQLMTLCFACATIAFDSDSATAAENLGDIVRKSGWDRIIGTWVDEETKGEEIRTTYAWRLGDHVIEAVTHEGEKETITLMALARDSGDVFHVGLDNEGGSSRGGWTFEGETAVVQLEYVTGAGRQASLRIEFEFTDNAKDSMKLTLGSPDPITIMMVRVKEEE